MTARGVRTLRGLAAAWFAVLVAALVHGLAGGVFPSWVSIAVALAFAGPICIALAGRTPSLWRLSVSVGLSQAALHLLFSAGTAAPVQFSGAAATHDGMIMSGSLTVSAGRAASSTMVMDSSWLMWAGHGLAALVTVAVLHRGEQILRRMLELAAMRLVRAARLVAPAVLTRPSLPLALAPVTLRDVAERLGAARHRGPPVLLAV